MAKVKKLAPVFLSAGIPDPLRNAKYISSVDIMAIREAITALTLLVTSRTRLIFGGHPAISPLVYLAAKSIKAENNVVIFQSNFFKEQVPRDSLAFKNLTWTPKSSDRHGSLSLMRRKMIGSCKFGSGVFIGGMEGVEDEFSLFKKLHPMAKVFPVASTGAAARILLERDLLNSDSEVAEDLRHEYLYGSLFRKLLL